MTTHTIRLTNEATGKEYATDISGPGVETVSHIVATCITCGTRSGGFRTPADAQADVNRFNCDPSLLEPTFRDSTAVGMNQLRG